MKVFKIGEVDYIAAETKQEAINYYKSEICDIDDEDFGVSELTDEQMNKFMHSGDDVCEEGYPITFTEELKRNIAEGIEFPCLFASSEI